MRSEEVLIPLMLVGFLFIALSALEGLLRHRRVGMMIKLHERLLDKFADASEFARLITTDAGQRYLNSMTLEPMRPHGRILRAVQAGVVLFSLGGGLAVLDPFFPSSERALLLAGVLTLSIGVGFLLAALISHRLSKSWGLYDGAPVQGLDG